MAKEIEPLTKIIKLFSRFLQNQIICFSLARKRGRNAAHGKNDSNRDAKRGPHDNDHNLMRVMQLHMIDIIS